MLLYAQLTEWLRAEEYWDSNLVKFWRIIDTTIARLGRLGDKLLEHDRIGVRISRS